MQVVLPKILPSSKHGLVFFLMGPVLGGDDWQYECAKLLLRKLKEDFTVVIPSRYGPDHPLNEYFAEGTEIFASQLTWERYFITLAANKSPRGCVIAWLPEESSVNPRPRETGPYARDTYGEIGELRGRIKGGERVRLVMGAEPGFPGLDVIVRNFQLAINKNILVVPKLEELVDRAIEVARTPLASD